jgi:tRNA A-37 threonylcarbamoyl transferase component Bud32/tetratricopeptide (TPR) repeat protein
MSSIYERLRQALAPGIELERPLKSGGMGHVFLGRDTILDRRIAVKTLREELATAVASERFILEAQSAARLQHPNVVRVYNSGNARGFLYFTMELIEGRTLDSVLAERKLTAAETAGLGRDLLAALAEAHRLGIVHRDVKPSNVFLVDGRAKLGDFGIARVLESSAPTLTATGHPLGTPLYMSPEQSRAKQVTAVSDIYSTGLVLFEACAGRRWPSGLDPGQGSWWDVPFGMRAPLRKALQIRPADRWWSAAEFAAALPGESTSLAAWPRLALTMAAVLLVAGGLGAAGYAAVHWLRRPSLPPCDLAIFPFESAGIADTSLARSTTRATEWYFRRLPHVVLDGRVPAAKRWQGSILPPGQRLAKSVAPCNNAAWARLTPNGGAVEAEVLVDNRQGEPLLATTIQGDPADALELGDRIGGVILGAIAPDLRSTYRRVGALVRVRPDAAAEFLRGEASAERDAWLPAVSHYEKALQLDSTFVLAAWRLGNARRWMPLRAEPPFPPGFRKLFSAHSGDLPQVDRLLVEAQFAASGTPRLDRYEAARSLAPNDPYVKLLYGDELFHRGPLSGRGLEEAADMLRGATVLDSTLAPAWEHLAWALIRLGRAREAQGALENLARVAGTREESEIYLPDFLRVAYAVRFDPTALTRGLPPPLQSSESLALAARGALAFDLAEAEWQLGHQLASLEGAPRPLHASGQVAQGIALVALGRPMAALAAFDSAATLFPNAGEARLQAAEWRVLPYALGVPGFTEADAATGRTSLEELAAQPDTGRAAWALAVDAFARRDSSAAARWQQLVSTRERAGGPRMALLSAMASAAQGDLASAVQLSSPALASDSAGGAPDPFFRATLHLLRGQWLATLGRLEEADREWLWYENTDVVGWPAAEAQPAEVDWALGTWAGVRRAGLGAGPLGRDRACALARRALTNWARPDPPVSRIADSVRASLARCS